MEKLPADKDSSVARRRYYLWFMHLLHFWKKTKTMWTTAKSAKETHADIWVSGDNSGECQRGSTHPEWVREYVKYLPFPTEQTADWKRDSTNRGCVIVDEEVGRFARAYQN